MVKNYLLLATSLLVSASAVAQSPQANFYNDVALTKMSPNGKYAAGENGYGNVTFVDIENNKSKVFEVDPYTYVPYYIIGLGNAISNNGIMVGKQYGFDDASYCFNGQWMDLPLQDNAPEGSYSAQGITPDGRRICGGVAIGNMMSDENTMYMAAAIWDDADGDGIFDKPVILPAPKQDFFGDTPQSIQALYISDDGKTVAAQMIDGRGFRPQPIVYTQAEDGSWSYKVLMTEYFVKKDLPPYPGDGPVYPSVETYLTEQEKAAYEAAVAKWNEELGQHPMPEDYISEAGMEAYQAAYDEWLAHGIETNPFPPEITEFMTEDELNAYNEDIVKYMEEMFNQPKIEDYLSEQAKAEYEAAIERYNKESDEYWKLMAEYSEKLSEMYEYIPNMFPNEYLLTPDGKYYIANAEAGSGATPILEGGYYTIEVATDKVSFTDCDVLLSCINNDGVLLAGTPGQSLSRTPLISLGFDKPFEDMSEYIKEISEDAYKWASELFGDIIGTPVCSTDLKTFAFYFGSYNEGGMSADMISYILPMSFFSGVESIAVDNDAIRVINGSYISLPAATELVEIYSLNGSKVFSASAPQTVINANLDGGIYVVKAVKADGKAVVAKISL